MISINNLSIQFNGNFLFEDVSFIINPKDRIGLVGKNGAGKTTLIRLLTKQYEPEAGSISLPKEVTLGYLPQEITLNSNRTVIEEAKTAFAEILRVKNTIEELTIAIGERTDYESEGYEKLIHRLTDLNDRFDLIDGSKMDEEAEKVLLGLGYLPTDFQRLVSEFSEGWQMRIELAKVLLSKPSALLLDEPTNHLDIESIQWLEDYLKVYPGAIVLVSHDRTFLDNITTRTIEITQGRIYDYKANYSRYVELREERLEIQKSSLENQEKEIQQIEQFIERFRYKSTKAKQVQSRIKMLDKIDRIELDDIDASSIHFLFPPAPHSGKVSLEGIHITKSYEEKIVLDNISFLFSRGDKIAFVGKNGEGKSTLSKIIVGQLEFQGKLTLGHQVKIGYFAQNQTKLLDPEKTVFETLDDIAVGDVRKKVRTILGSFLFGGEAIDKKVKVLSGGEKTRLALAKLLLEPVNVLVLDEPTNHLDMVSKDILKNALIRYDGTLILVSHDRDFLDGLSQKIYEFKNKKIKEHMGDVYDFLLSKKIDSFTALEASSSQKDFIQKETNGVSENKLSYEAKKEQEKEKKRILNAIQKAEKNIALVEEKLRLLETELATPSPTTDINEVLANYNNLKVALDNEMNTWENLVEQSTID